MYKNSIILILSILFTIPFISCEPKEDPDNCKDCTIAYKPNIYIYPSAKTELDVSLDFPMGGNVIASIPEYNTGWSVTVDTDGTIDEKYGFLFYESEQPDIWQRTQGWTVEKTELESFLTANMYSFGFQENEVTDFIDYWIPRLNEHSFYNIYPQTSDLIDDVIRLNFSKQPDKTMRLFYVIKGLDEKPTPSLSEPVIPCDFLREGFIVMEWGVVLDN